MDGRNSTGRTISLLNIEHIGLAGAYPSKCSTSSSAQSSRTPTPGLSPHLLPTSPSCTSPETPSFNPFDHAPHAHPHKPQQQQYYIRHQPHAKMDDQNVSMYPPLPDATGGTMPSAYPMPPQMQQHMPPQNLQQVAYRTSPSPVPEPSRVSTTTNTKSHTKKNQYPCPLAKQIGCNDFFTTSGHAARHAKKHTGKKDAFCPECNKAFTRKDNMEQHRRTHQNGRAAPRSNNGDAAKVKKPVKPAIKKPTIKAESQFEAAIEQQLVEQQEQEQMSMQTQPQIVQMPHNLAMQQSLLDQALMMPPSGPYFIGNGMDTGPVPALPMAMPDLNGRPPLLRNNFTTSLEYGPPAASMVADPDGLHYSYPSPGLSNGLNSLALAASEHRRLSEEKSSSGSPQRSPSQETP
ncbi:hypothetical protein B0A55_05020 [Friedmanniomyces simplex]|uniref:C2H2-type domain-containing protein n=1 Tax=Friedmanniomyces simplex TaxID=329884 RepID=A0A4U0XK25_9PEZI|nr:hypothetical protein B0A55_05020 [Friedmanniomyces simplex]